MTDARRFRLGILPKRSLPRGLLVLALPMTFRTFQYFPGMRYVQEAWFIFCFFAVLFIYPFWKLRTGLRFSWFEVYLLLLMVADVVLAAWRAHEVFGQPLLYGILAQRVMTLIAILLILVNALRCGMVELADIEAAFLFLAWGTFFLFSAMRLFLNPANFISVGFVTEPMPGTKASFALQGYFILFGVLYYAILGMRTRRAKYYLAAAILFPATLGATGRGLTVCAAATLLIFLYRLRGLQGTVRATVKFACIAAVLGGILYAISPAMISARLTGFSDAFKVVLTGSPTTLTGSPTTGDVSANARIFETLTALPYIQEHPLLGNGVISVQWQGGAAAVLGDYFHAEDIGVIGIVFSYGILGLLLYLYQYRFAWSAAKKLPGSFHTPLLDATKAFALYTALYSLETGMCVWSAGVTLFFVALLSEIAVQASSAQLSDTWTEKECSLQRPA